MVQTAAKDSESSVHGEMMGQPESSESSSPPRCQEKIRPITKTGKFFEKKNNGAERESQETFTWRGDGVLGCSIPMDGFKEVIAARVWYE